MNITPSTQLYAVLGHPITHSLSPRMQNAAFQRLGIDAVYLAFDVRPERLISALHVMAEMGFAGINLTVPLKEVAFRGLKNLDSSAKLLGSVNTVKFLGNGMKGYSTDGRGFLSALNKVFACTPRGLSICLLGCGGAGRAVGLACASAGAKKIFLADNETSRAKKLMAEILAANEAPRGKSRGNLLRRSSLGYAGRVFAEPCEARSARSPRPELGTKAEASERGEASERARNAIPPCGNPQGFLAKKGDNTEVEIVAVDRLARNRAARASKLIIQATPIGMHKDDAPLLDAEAFGKNQMLYDLIYMFPQTGLMKIAKRNGCRTANGLDMLAFQGAASFSIWTGMKAPVEAMRKALKQAVYG